MYFSKVPPNIFIIETYSSLFIIKFEIWYSSSTLSSFKSNFRSARNRWWTNFVFQSLELPGSWTVCLKTLTYAVTAEVTELNNRKVWKGSRVFPARGVERGEVKNIRFKHELKVTFLFNFLRLSEKVYT